MEISPQYYHRGTMSTALGSIISFEMQVSHFSLLLGMAGPVWLMASPISSEQNGNVAPASSGRVILGIADSAASALGRRFGRHKILGTNKSLEGTIGGIACSVIAWAILGLIVPHVSLWQVTVASIMSCLLEASTTQLDIYVYSTKL